MGRPKLNVRQISLQITPEILARIDALVGAHRRSGFIRQAIETELRRAEADRAADQERVS